MNKKLLTGFMLLMAAGIWGYVGLQLFSGQAAGEAELPGEIPANKTPVIHVGQNEPLLLNYTDPFLKEETRTGVQPANKQTAPAKPMVKKEEKPETPVYTWPTIVYRGLIRNKNQPDKLIGVIVINGQEKIVRKGEKVNELNVSGIDKNKVELAYEKEKRIFLK